MIDKFFKKDRKTVSIVVGIVITIIISIPIYNIVFKEVYYLHKDSFVILKNKIRVKRIGSESVIQGFLRNYLAGSTDYKAKIPFTYETLLLSASHDKDKKILVLNWNSYFYKALEKDIVEEEIKLLLFSLKRNFNISTVFFLVEGAPINISLGDIDLSREINPQNINLEKNIKK